MEAVVLPRAFPTPQRVSAGGLSWTKGGERLVESW